LTSAPAARDLATYEGSIVAKQDGRSRVAVGFDERGEVAKIAEQESPGDGGVRRARTHALYDGPAH
jgi:hypothetical protein